MTTSDADDEVLIARARRGGAQGQQAYGLLVTRYQNRLVGLLRHLLGGSADAEDIAQDAFVRTFLALDRYPRGAAFWPWLRTVAARLAFNHRRDGATRKRYEDKMRAQCASRSALPEREAMDQALSKLSYPYREALVLRHVEGMSVKDLAEGLGIGTSAAKMRLARARSEFQAEFERVTE